MWISSLGRCSKNRENQENIETSTKESAKDSYTKKTEIQGTKTTFDGHETHSTESKDPQTFTTKNIGQETDTYGEVWVCGALHRHTLCRHRGRQAWISSWSRNLWPLIEGHRDISGRARQSCLPPWVATLSERKGKWQRSMKYPNS